MKRMIIFVIIYGFIITSCTKQRIAGKDGSHSDIIIGDKIQTETITDNYNDENSVVIEQKKIVVDSFSLNQLYEISNLRELKYDEIIDPIFWNNSFQEGMYRILFNKKDIDGIIKFREFIESLAKYHHDDPVFEYNPVLLAIDNYSDLLPALYIKRADLFLHGHIHQGDYSLSPIIYTLRNGKYSVLQFFFDNNINWEKSIELYGSGNRGGTEYPLGGNLLTDARNENCMDYLINKGFETERDLTGKEITIRAEATNVFSEPDFNSTVVCQLERGINIPTIKITMYKNYSYQWIQIETVDGYYGCIPFNNSVYYDTGI
jgi:hypothetical protein